MSSSTPQTAVSQSVFRSDVLEDHAVSWGKQGERIARHNILRDALHATAQTASLGGTKEDRDLLPGSEARPVDVLIPNCTWGRALDIHVRQVMLHRPPTLLRGWHESTTLQVKKIASAQARQTGDEQTEVTRHLYQKMAVLLAMRNATLLVNRLPTFPSPDLNRKL